MRLLVTGAAGFIGANVCAAARAAGHRVVGCDVRYGSDVRRLAAWPPPYFDAVVHCAAKVVTTAAKAAAGTAVAENLEIDAALFRWAAKMRPGRVVYFSSSCAYPAAGPMQWRDWRLREDDIDLRSPEWPDGLYGWIKLTGEQLAAQLAADGVPVTVVRPFSVYGPGMRDGFAVSGFCGQARRRADPLVIWGDDEQTRDYIHVTDVAAAVLAAIEAGVDGPVNLGTGRPTSLAGLAQIVTAAAGYSPAVKVDEAAHRGLAYLVADPGRLRQFYEPRITLEDGVAELVR